MSERTLPIRFDLIGEDAIVQGAYWSRQFSFIFTDDTLWNTAGFYAGMKIRAAIGSPVLIDGTVANGIMAVGIQGTVPDQYNLSITITGANTSSLADWGRGVYDVILVDTFNRVYRVLEGHCSMSRAVT